MFADGRAIAYPLLVRTVWRPFQPRSADPADVWHSLAFVRGFDSRDYLRKINHRTLVFVRGNAIRSSRPRSPAKPRPGFPTASSK